MINALITNKNNPKVSTVIGRVKITKIGLKKTLRSPRTTATIKAVVKLPHERLSKLKADGKSDD
jgi:hypothetical protein